MKPKDVTYLLLAHGQTVEVEFHDKVEETSAGVTETRKVHVMYYFYPGRPEPVENRHLEQKKIKALLESGRISKFTVPEPKKEK